MLPLFESSARDALRMLLTAQSEEQAGRPAVPHFQVVLKSQELPAPLRSLTADHVNKYTHIYTHTYKHTYIYYKER